MITHTDTVNESDAGPRGLLPRAQLRGFRLLHPLDALAVFSVMVVVMLVRFGTEWPSATRAEHLFGFGAATAIHLVVFYFGGLYEREYRLGRRTWVSRVAGLEAMALVFTALIILPTGRYPIPRGNLIFVGLGATLAITGLRILSRRLRAMRFGPPRVFIVGTPDDIEMAGKHLVDSDRVAQIVGSSTSPAGLADVVDDLSVSDILLVSETAFTDIYPEPLSAFDSHLVGVYMRVRARDTLLGLRQVREIAGMPFVTLRSQALPNYKLRLKRILDLTVLLVLAPLAIPILGAVALYVRIVAGRGVLFRQERTGRNGTSFEMVKFRTMVHGAEEHTGAVKATQDDPRVVRGCHILRRLRLDELPQGLNVLRGEMSIVGPRPERPEMSREYEALIPGYARRNTIPPGITGLAQIRGEYHTDPEYKLGHDIQYIVNWSPVLDLTIMVRTLPVALGRRG